MKDLASWCRTACAPILSVVTLALAPVFAQPTTDPVTVSQFNLPAQNAQGWTILTPASDSRLVYVDPVNGNDTSNIFYLPGDAAVGPNPQSPTGSVVAVKTLAKANSLIREDKPDWILLKAGGVWTGQSLDVKRGRSASERAVVCAYGTGARPELRTGTARAIADYQMVNVIVQGIRFWAHTRDTDGPHFTGYGGTGGFILRTLKPTELDQVRDVLIEDCIFRAYTTNEVKGNIDELNNPPVMRFVMRRSIISGNFREDGHSFGLYHSGYGQPLQPTILLQENTFDHNGWRIVSELGTNLEAAGQATIFNHNTYFTAAKGVIFERNLFLRASSIGNKWTSPGVGEGKGIVLDNNLYAEGEIGISMGGNKPHGPLRFHDIRIRNNVFTDIGRVNTTKRANGLSWGIEAQDWKVGVIQDNLIIHQRKTSLGNTFGIQVTAHTSPETGIDGDTEDVWVQGNVLANLRAGSEALVRLNDGGNVSNVRFEDNIVQTPSASPLVSLSTGGYGFDGYNQYFSAAAAGERFVVNGVEMNLANWVAASGDTGAIDTAPVFPAPTRDLEGYIAHLGMGSSFQHFIDAVTSRQRGVWNPALSAAAINDWLRAGFGLPATSAASWTSQDIGIVAGFPAGSTSHNAGTGVFTIQASGADITGTSDQFRYVTLNGGLQGDGEIVVRVTSLTNTNNWAKAGVMIRNGLANNAANVAVFVSPNGNVSFQRRLTTGGTTTTTLASGLGAPRWLKLVRSGNNFSAYHSANGTAWTQLGSTAPVTLPSSALIGMAVTSHSSPTLTTAVIDNVAATP